MKKKLMALLKTKQEARAAKTEQVEKSEKVEEVRTLGAEIESLNSEIRDLEGMIADLPDEKDERSAAVNGEIPGVVKAGAKEARRSVDETNMEYRKAFQNYVLNGTEIPAELRTDENTLTTDIPGAIPTVLMDKIIEKMESIGDVLSMVTKTNYAAGVAIPTSSVKPVATWVGEGEGSDRQKKSTVNITFGSFKLRCEISMSLATSVMALSAFEKAFVKNVVDAMIKKIESTILSSAD